MVPAATHQSSLRAMTTLPCCCLESYGLGGAAWGQKKAVFALRTSAIDGMKARRTSLHIRRRPYVVIYEYIEDEDVVMILRVVHGRRDIASRFVRGG